MTKFGIAENREFLIKFYLFFFKVNNANEGRVRRFLLSVDVFMVLVSPSLVGKLLFSYINHMISNFAKAVMKHI